MEHAKKMVLIPHENIQQIKNHHHQQQHQLSLAMMVNSEQTPGTSLSRLDAELEFLSHGGIFKRLLLQSKDSRGFASGMQEKDRP